MGSMLGPNFLELPRLKTRFTCQDNNQAVCRMGLGKVSFTLKNPISHSDETLNHAISD